MASQTVVHPVPLSKPADKVPKPKSTVLEWIRAGCKFPGKVRP